MLRQFTTGGSSPLSSSPHLSALLDILIFVTWGSGFIYIQHGFVPLYSILIWCSSIYYFLIWLISHDMMPISLYNFCIISVQLCNQTFIFLQRATQRYCTWVVFRGAKHQSSLGQPYAKQINNLLYSPGPPFLLKYQRPFCGKRTVFIKWYRGN